MCYRIKSPQPFGRLQAQQQLLTMGFSSLRPLLLSRYPHQTHDRQKPLGPNRPSFPLPPTFLHPPFLHSQVGLAIAGRQVWILGGRIHSFRTTKPSAAISFRIPTQPICRLGTTAALRYSQLAPLTYLHSLSQDRSLLERTTHHSHTANASLDLRQQEELIIIQLINPDLTSPDAVVLSNTFHFPIQDLPNQSPASSSSSSYEHHHLYHHTVPPFLYTGVLRVSS